jgi:hypothetical protein
VKNKRPKDHHLLIITDLLVSTNCSLYQILMPHE